MKTLTTLMLLAAMSPAHGWNKVFEGELTTGRNGSLYGYSTHHATPYGTLSRILQDSSPVPDNGDLNNIRFLHYDNNHVYLGLPDNSANADSLFQRMAVIYNDTVQTYARKDGHHSRVAVNGQYVQQWRWPDSHNPAPRAVNETVTIEITRPPATFGGNYKAKITVADNGASEFGYENTSGRASGRIRVTDPDPGRDERRAQDYNVNHHVGTVKGILSYRGSVYLFLDNGTDKSAKNNDNVFTTMRLAQDVSAARDGSDIRYWDFKRNDATFSNRYGFTAFEWDWDTAGIPAVGRTFTLELKDSGSTGQSCTWIRKWDDCDAVTKTQTLNPVSSAPGCAPAAPKPATETHNCGQCEIRDMNTDGNLGCFHRHEKNRDRIPQIQSSLPRPEYLPAGQLEGRESGNISG